MILSHEEKYSFVEDKGYKYLYYVPTGEVVDSYKVGKSEGGMVPETIINSMSTTEIGLLKSKYRTTVNETLFPEWCFKANIGYIGMGILTYMIDHVNYKNYVVCSVDDIVEWMQGQRSMDVSRRSVERGINSLRESNTVVCERRSAKGDNLYKITPHLVWKGDYSYLPSNSALRG